MIGIIEKVIVECLMEVGDDALREDVFREAAIPLDRVYRLDQHYPDAETGRLIGAVLKVTGLSSDQLYELFSIVFFNVIEDVFPEFLRMCNSSEELVRKQAKIHALIAAGSRNPGESSKSTDKFSMQDEGPHRITVRYHSELQLCGLYETLVRVAAERFGDTVEIPPHDCRAGRSDQCRISVRWTSIGGRKTHLTGEGAGHELDGAAHV